MSLVNKALWIDSNNQLSLHLITDVYKPTGTQVLIKVAFSGINPADIKHATHLGLNNYPSGYEYSGAVIAVGPEAKYAVGDLICGQNYIGKGTPIYLGAHQDILIGEHAMYKIPAKVPLPAAACMCGMVSTAADALFNQLGLPDNALPAHAHQQASPPDPGGPVPILIWGDSSGVGVTTIQQSNLPKQQVSRQFLPRPRNIIMKSCTRLAPQLASITEMRTSQQRSSGG